MVKPASRSSRCFTNRHSPVLDIAMCKPFARQNYQSSRRKDPIATLVFDISGHPVPEKPSSSLKSFILLLCRHLLLLDAIFSTGYRLAVSVLRNCTIASFTKVVGFAAVIHDCWPNNEPLASLYSEDGRGRGHQPTTNDRVVNPTATSK